MAISVTNISDALRLSVNIDSGREHNTGRMLMLLAFLTVLTVSRVSAQDEGSRRLENFTGDQFFITSQLWEGRGGTSIVVVHDGTVIAFHGRNSAVQFAYSNLNWILDGKDVSFFIKDTGTINKNKRQ